MRVSITVTGDESRAWLDERVFRSVGLRRSYREIAKLSGLSPATITAVLKGERELSGRVIRQLAPVLRVSEVELGRRTGSIPLVEIDVPLSQAPVDDERSMFTSALEEALNILRTP